MSSIVVYAIPNIAFFLLSSVTWVHFCVWGHLKDFSLIERDKERKRHMRAHAGGKLAFVFICLTDTQQGPFYIHYAWLPVMFLFHRQAGE